MKILVINDNQTNIDSALSLLSDHDVTTISSFNEFEKMHHEKKDFLKEYDAVLTDLFMPFEDSMRSMVPEYTAGELVPFGTSVVFLALQEGVRYIGMCTDGGHHAHPLLWAMDMSGYSKDKEVFKIGNSTFCICNASDSRGRYPKHNDGKNWLYVLNRLQECL